VTGDFECARRSAAFILEKYQMLTHLFFRDFFGRQLNVRGKPPNSRLKNGDWLRPKSNNQKLLVSQPTSRLAHETLPL
jgi:hypothetical protein